MFLNDQETAVDLLYYRAIAETVVKLIRATGEAPITIGIHGDWGAGKSSILAMTKESLAKDGETVVLNFNGWQFQGFEDAKVVLIEKILGELKRQKPGIAKFVDTLSKRVDWLKMAKKSAGLLWTATTGIPTPDQIQGAFDALSGFLSKPDDAISVEQAKKAAENAAEFLKQADAESVPEQIHAFHEEFAKLLVDAKIKQLVVVIDDLDRCLPRTAIETLEAIRLFLFAPRTAFVIATDEGMIEYAVKQYFPDLPLTAGSATYARNYLEKLIQVPFRIPALGYAETRTYVTLLLAQAALGEKDENFKKLLGVAEETLKRPWLGLGVERTAIQKAMGQIPAPIEEALRMSDQLSRMLTEGTRGNPRQIKRFLNSLRLRAAIAEARGFGADIQLPVLAKIILAERFAPDFYEELTRVAAADGKPAKLALLEDEARGKEADKEAKKAAAESEEWPSQEWAKVWATIDPPLKGVDLRPYLFVTRDKRSALGIVAASGNLEQLLERLGSSSAFVVKQTESEVSKLSKAEAEQMFSALCSRVSQATDLTLEPSGAKGLTALAKAHTWLQPALVSFIGGLPVSRLGFWVVSGWALTDLAADAAFKKLLAGWAAQKENAALQKAATAMANMPTGRKGR